MSRVVFLAPAHPGHINPTIGLVRELVSRREEVLYYSSEKYRQKIESTGAVFRNYGYVGEHPTQGETNPSGLEGLVEQVRRRLQSSREIYRYMVERVSSDKPDYIIHDSFCLFGKQIARRLGIPAVASVGTVAYNRKIIEVDPEGFTKYLVREPDMALTSGISKIVDMLSATFRKAYDIEDLMDVFLAKEELNIIYNSRLFQIHSDTFDDTCKFVGASIYPRNDTTDFPFEKLDGRPLICIAMGNVVNKGVAFYRKCFDALKDMDRQVIVSTGGRLDLQDLGEIPENFLVLSHIPQLDILERAKLFISHGGINSVIEALYNYVPLVMDPLYRDQCLTANRVDELGAGIYLRDSGFSAKNLRDAVERVLGDESFANNARVIGESLRSAGGYVRAAEEIAAFKLKNKIP